MNKFIAKYVLPYLKAHLGGLSGAFALALSDAHGNLASLGSLTGTQWTGIVVTALGVGAFVAGATNTPYVADVPVVLPSQDSAPVAGA